MKKLHIWLMTVLGMMMALVMVAMLTGCNMTETPDGGEGSGDGSGDGTEPITESKGLDFEKIEDTETYAVVGLGNCKDAKVVIPATYRNKPVVTVNATAFVEKCGSVTEIYVPDSVKTIESGAFSGCTALQKLTIPVLTGRLNAYFSNGVPTTLKTVILTAMTAVPQYAFSGCTSLEEVEFPSNATQIGWACLEGCKNIKKITTPFVGTNTYYSKWHGDEFDNFFFCNDHDQPGGRAHLYNFWGLYLLCTENWYVSKSYAFFSGDDNRSDDPTEYVPAGTISLTVTNGYITDLSCCDTKLSEVIISGSSMNDAKGIGQRAFTDCTSLASITIPSSVTEIGNGAFEGCTSLTSANIPNGVTRIGYDAFYNCALLTSISIPNSVTHIDCRAFQNCTSLTSITIPSSVNSVGADAFEGCTSLTTANVFGCAMDLEDTFSGCTFLATVNISNGVKKLSGTFKNCTSLTSVHLPSSVEEMLATFEGCTSLVNVNIPNAVVHLYQTFKGCTSLQSITIPGSVTTIAGGPFADCTSLTTIRMEDTTGWCVLSYGKSTSISNPIDYLRGDYYLIKED